MRRQETADGDGAALHFDLDQCWRGPGGLPRTVDGAARLTALKPDALQTFRMEFLGAAMEPNSPLNPGDEAAPGTPGSGEDICQHCQGKGNINGQDCPMCGGSGKITEGIGGG
jgi:hypothetical protein